MQDAIVLAKSGHGKTSGALNLLKGLGKETENLVWTGIDSAVADVASAWWEQPEDVRSAVAGFRRSLFAPIVERLGFDPAADEDADISELRQTAVTAAAHARDPHTTTELRSRFARYVDQDDDAGIAGDLRQITFIEGVRSGGEKEYEKVLSVYKKPPSPQHKTSAMYALCYGATPELRKRTLDMIATDVREQVRRRLNAADPRRT